MGHLHYLIGLLFIIIFTVEYSNALQCYSCNSVNDKRCLGDESNKLDETMKITCDATTPDGKHSYKLCRKIKQIIDFEVNGMQPDSRVIRYCGWDDTTYKNKCYQRSGFGGRQEVCACETDNCNGSNALIASSSLLIAVLFLLKLNVV